MSNPVEDLVAKRLYSHLVAKKNLFPQSIQSLENVARSLNKVPGMHRRRWRFWLRRESEMVLSQLREEGYTG
jgi:hypothetical protein